MKRVIVAVCTLGALAGVIALATNSSRSAPPVNKPTPSTSNDASTPKVEHGVNHVLSTGQSLSVGMRGSPVLSTKQPFGNLMFSTGVFAGDQGLVAFAPLVEGPAEETMSSGLANLVSQLAPGTDLLISVHGISGTPYAGLKKGTSAFAEGVAQIRAGAAISKKLGQPYVVRAVTNVHGESDHLARNTNYERDLFEWQSDYEKEVIAIVGQSESVPMLQTQMSSWSAYGDMTSAIPAAQLAAHINSRGKIVLVGPKYHLEYSGDGVHLSNIGYRHMGEDYAKVYRRVVLEKESWEPVRPKSITRTGAMVVVKFFVPAPPLVLDESLVTNPGAYGFEWFDEGGADAGSRATSITNVRVTASDTVTITLSGEPSGANKRLRYAFTSRPSVGAGPKTGPRGNLRDSEKTASRHGTPLFNWCVHFDEPVL